MPLLRERVPAHAHILQLSTSKCVFLPYCISTHKVSICNIRSLCLFRILVFYMAFLLHSVDIVTLFNGCLAVINPRRACAARVTVLGLSVCLSVPASTRF